MAVRERKFFVGGNWKMNGSKAKIEELVELLVFITSKQESPCNSG